VNNKSFAVSKFYSLQEAYDQGLLTHEDLQSIAYYHNGGYFDVNEEFTGWGYDENFTPVPKTPEILNVETENKIKELQAYNLRTREPNATAENVAIIEYYGNSIIIWKT
jgi:hypothetical protein